MPDHLPRLRAVDAYAAPGIATKSMDGREPRDQVSDVQQTVRTTLPTPIAAREQGKGELLRVLSTVPAQAQREVLFGRLPAMGIPSTEHRHRAPACA